ncbi:MAG: MraY family glycosyltransferase [Rikenellaceae bacterium]
MLIILLSFVISFVLVAFMLPYVLILSLRKRLIDPIDPRKVHSVPASRLGGLTFFPSFLFSMWFCISLTHLTQSIFGVEIDIDVSLIMETLALLSLYIIGVYDDVLGVPYRNKFAGQIFAGGLIIAAGVYFKTLHGFFGIDEIPAYIGIPVTLFIYVFVTNAINLIDGIDGLASLLSIMALLVYGIQLFHNGELEDSIFAVATLGALVPFWYHNVFGIKKGAGSKIFMGDTGALVIGSVLGLMAVKIWNISFYADTNAPIASSYYVLAYTMLLVPCFDVVRIVFHRYRAKKPLFLPDKNHIHHKFMALGFSARRSLGWIVAINICFVVINLLLSLCVSITVIVAIDIVLWTLMHLYISRCMKLYKLARQKA